MAAEQVIRCRDEQVGLCGVIVIDDTTLGPGLGGIRLRPYPDLAAAEAECRRLAAAMTLKNAVAELPFGGAKAVIVDGGDIPDRAALLRRFGAFVAAAGGDYLPGVDMGTTTDDLALVGEAGAEVSCSEEDPSPWTAAGVRAAIAAALAHDGREVASARVLVQGAGQVGAALAGLLAEDGAHVLVADADPARARRAARATGATVIDPARALREPCDVLAPCAVAGVLGPRTIPSLRCRIVAGAANDTLAGEADARRLAASGILYVPDFVANAGGVIHIHAVREGWGRERLSAAVERIGERTAALLAEAAAVGGTPLDAARARARARLAGARRVEALS